MICKTTQFAEKYSCCPDCGWIINPAEAIYYVPSMLSDFVPGSTVAIHVKCPK